MSNKVIIVLLYSAHKVVPKTIDNYHAVLTANKDRVTQMLDLSLDKHIVWKEYDELLFSWFIQDSHPIKWDRLIMVDKYFTVNIINSMSIFKMICWQL